MAGAMASRGPLRSRGPRRQRVGRRPVGVLARGPAVRGAQREDARVPERGLREGEGVRRVVARHGRVPRHLAPAGRPARRRALRTTDWQRSRYFWARVGYDRIFKATEGEGSPAVAEDRGILSLWGKFPVPAGVWLEGRTRTDFRWIADEYSNRYRVRVEAHARVQPARPLADVPTSTSSGSTTRATTTGHASSTSSAWRSPSARASASRCTWPGRRTPARASSP